MEEVVEGDEGEDRADCDSVGGLVGVWRERGRGYAMEGGDEQREVVLQGRAAGVGGVVGVGAELLLGAGEAVEGGWACFEGT